MTPTAKQIAQMKEAQFQTEVLIPLFKAMKFRAITNYGGGSLELGKDLVMWREEDLRERVNYGVVIKARTISGKATGKGSANEVYFQIKQCFDAPFCDLTSTEEQRVHRCWVVCSKEIKKEAINAIRSLLTNENLDRVTTFIGPERLLELMNEFMPERGVLDQLEATQEKIDELARDDHYRVVANTKKQFSIEPRYPGAEKDKPFLISALLRFNTKDAQGKRSRDDFLRHLKTGAPVEIKSPHLKEFVLPEFLRELIKPTKNMTITLGPARINKRFLFKFEIHRDGLEVAALDYLDFEVVQAGTEELTLSNEQQPVPWTLKVIFNMAEKRFGLNYNINYDNLNVTQALQFLRFHRAIGEGGELRIITLDSGLQFSIPFSKSRNDTNLNQWIQLFDEVAFIQSKTNIPISVPNHGVSSEEAKAIFMAAEIIRTGRAEMKVASWPVESRLIQAQSALEGFSEQSIHSLTLNYEEGHKVTIFGSEIPLGPSVVFCEKAYITKKDLANLKRDIDKATADDNTIHYSISPYQGCVVEAKFLKWLPPAEAEEIRRLPIFGESNGTTDSEAPSSL